MGGFWLDIPSLFWINHTLMPYHESHHIIRIISFDCLSTLFDNQTNNQRWFNDDIVNTYVDIRTPKFHVLRGEPPSKFKLLVALVTFLRIPNRNGIYLILVVSFQVTGHYHANCSLPVPDTQLWVVACLKWALQALVCFRKIKYHSKDGALFDSYRVIL